MLAWSARRRALDGDPSPEATAERAAIDATRTARSRELLPLIQQAYRLGNANGDERTLHKIFAPKAPPAGAGDCAAPKLLAHAYGSGFARSHSRSGGGVHRRHW